MSTSNAQSTLAHLAGQTSEPEITDVMSVGFAPNGYEMKSWREDGRRYTEFWQPCPGGGYVTWRGED